MTVTDGLTVKLFCERADCTFLKSFALLLQYNN